MAYVNHISLPVIAYPAVIKQNNVFVSYYAGKTAKTAWRMNTDRYHVSGRKARVLNYYKSITNYYKGVTIIYGDVTICYG